MPQFVSLVRFGATAVEPQNGAVRAEVAGDPVPDLGSALIAVALIARLGWGRLARSEPRRPRRGFSQFSHTIGAGAMEITDAASALLLGEVVLIVVARVGLRAVDPRTPDPAQA